MFIRGLIAAGVALFASLGAANAQTTINGSYSAVPTGTAGYLPTINYDGTAQFLHSPFSESLTVGATTAVSTFLQVAPINGSSSLGTLTGTVAVAFTFTAPGNSSVTGVTYSAGANPVTLSNGVISLAANYELFYGNGTDCITWSSSTCSAAVADSSTIGDTIVVTFADHAVLNVNLYNWSDWIMTPQITFKLVSAPTAVPEPASFAIFGTAIVGLGLIGRRRRPATVSATRKA